jgi:hypothetical protein
VTDIREQYPLDRDETRRIAAGMGVRHPADRQSKTDIVMSTDFLVDLRNASDRTQLVARSVKLASDLDDERTIEKQEIERRYWANRDVDWGVVTEQSLPVQRVKTLRWLHEMLSLKDMTESYPGYWDNRCASFLACLPQATGMTVKQFVRVLESREGFAVGEALKILRHLAANKRISIDLDVEFDMKSSMNSYRATEQNVVGQPERKIA